MAFIRPVNQRLAERRALRQQEEQGWQTKVVPMVSLSHGNVIAAAERAGLPWEKTA